jgi:anthranilate phosphoribosyltransferase
MEAFKPLIAKAAAGLPLTRAEAALAFSQMLSGEVTPAQMAGFLMALRVRGESVDEITGAVSAMRERMLRVEAPAGAIDVVGTGGDASGSWNVSTLAGLIVAACGVPVAKHGNRAASSKSGAADVLQALGVKIGQPPEGVAGILRAVNFAFMLAPAHHPAMRNVAPVRTELATRTMFNLLGPLSNPAGVKRLLLGVFSADWQEPIAQTLRDLGTERAWIVHGSDGLDEMTTTGPTHVLELDQGVIRRFEVTPEEAGLSRAASEALKGGEPSENAHALRAVVAGEKNAYRDIAVLNAAGALVVAGKAMNLGEGAALAAQALDQGRVAELLAQLVRVSNG